uniref:Uncharacterized protein n=2 Tax=Oryza sativa subsp. japonica TaxID=39947 RepID=Q6YTL1_ORYSJ|nr:hypothetical protein [Oryza sativa Japonica Group]
MDSRISFSPNALKICCFPMGDLWCCEKQQQQSGISGRSCDVGEEGLRGDAVALEGSLVHVLEHDLELVGLFIHAVAPHDGRVWRTRSISDNEDGAGATEPTEFGGVRTPLSEKGLNEDVDYGRSGSSTARDVRSCCGSRSVRSGRRRDRPGVPN